MTEFIGYDIILKIGNEIELIFSRVRLFKHSFKCLKNVSHLKLKN